MRNFSRIALFLLIALVSNTVNIACADANNQKIRWSLVWENDAIAHDDGGYTNGFALNWGHLLDSVDDTLWQKFFSDWLPFPLLSDSQEAVSYQLAHTTFTPSNIDTPTLIEDDRPYAGLLYGALNLYRFDSGKSSRYEFLLGTVGPASGAEYIQRYAHDVIDTIEPSGWHHQLSNEIVIRVGYEQLWRLYQSSFSNGIEYDLLSAADIRAGNLSSDIGGGASIRAGRGLRSSFPMAWLTPGRTLPSLAGNQPGDWNLFVTLHANYLFNDITVEGNTFKDSHGVHLINLQGQYVVGGSYQFTSWAFSAAIQESSHAFEESDESTVFSTFSLSFLW